MSSLACASPGADTTEMSSAELSSCEVEELRAEPFSPCKQPLRDDTSFLDDVVLHACANEEEQQHAQQTEWEEATTDDYGYDEVDGHEEASHAAVSPVSPTKLKPFSKSKSAAARLFGVLSASDLASSTRERLNSTASTPTSCGNSPSSKSVASEASSSSKSWFSSLSRAALRARRGDRKKKRSLREAFDSSLSSQSSSFSSVNSNGINAESKLNLFNTSGASQTTVSRPQAPLHHPRLSPTESASDLLELSRMATTDLLGLGVRCHSNDDVLNGEDSDSNVTPRREGRRMSPHPQTYYTVDCRSAALRKKRNLCDQKLLSCVKQFNSDPARGLDALAAAGILDRGDARAVASFLFREGRLSKKAIGSFIGDHDAFNRQVLAEFVKCHEFTHLILVQALRQFLWSFRLPGEAMQIDRVMEAFALHYCAQNPNLFEDVDTCYILSFSIIMLNTALHNPNVRQKITVEQFVKQNKGINGKDGKDLPRDILEHIYGRIKEEPFKIPDETYDDLMYTFFSPDREGWLQKQGGSWKNWKRRWFVLSDRCLYYFEHTTENVPKGIIPLENVRVRAVDDHPSLIGHRGFAFELFTESGAVVKGCKTDSKGTVVQGNHKIYRFSASTSEDRACWVQCLQESIRENPFHDMIENKKSALRKRLRAQQQQQGQGTPQALKLSRQKLNGTPSGISSAEKKVSRQRLGLDGAGSATPSGSPQVTPIQQRKTSKHRLHQLQSEFMVTSTPKQQSGDDPESGVEAVLPAATHSHDQPKSPQVTPSKA